MFRHTFRPLRPGDWAVLVAAILIVISLTLLSARGSAASQVRIDGPDESWVYPLDADVEVEVPGPLGITHVHIHDGSVSVSESPCRQKICIASGEISAIGTFIACLPNRVLVRIEGRKEGEVDGLAF
jgi:hypothetical protein